MKLKGKVAIITGAGSGIGKEIATVYAQEGAKIVAADINEDALNTTVREIKQNDGEITAAVTDIANKESVENMIRTAVDFFGSLDILVNNAGVSDSFIPVGDYTDEMWEKHININLTGPFMASRAALNIMVNQENGGNIINIISVAGHSGGIGGAGYVASKHGLEGLTKNIAVTHGKKLKIRCNGIAPGGVKTNMQNTKVDAHPLGFETLKDVGPNYTRCEPVDIANVVLFLASEESKYINGQIITVDGGWTAR